MTEECSSGIRQSARVFVCHLFVIWNNFWDGMIRVEDLCPPERIYGALSKHYADKAPMLVGEHPDRATLLAQLLELERKNNEGETSSP